MAVMAANEFHFKFSYTDLIRSKVKRSEWKLETECQIKEST